MATKSKEQPTIDIGGERWTLCHTDLVQTCVDLQNEHDELSKTNDALRGELLACYDEIHRLKSAGSRSVTTAWDV